MSWLGLGTLTFATPWVAWCAAASPLFVLAVVVYDRARRRQLTTRLGELPVVGRLMASASSGRRVVKAVLAALALAALLLAIARPRIVGRREVEVRGLDLVIAVDVSKSMLVDDVGPTDDMLDAKQTPTRLGRARELALALIDALPGDRIGPIVFAGAASHFPVTEDHQVAAQYLTDLGPADLPPGSNLGEVFRVARCLLRPDLYDDLGCAKIGRRGHGGDPLPGEKPEVVKKVDDDAVEQRVERGKAVVVFTDGGEPDDDARREVATAHELGIAVFMIGVGTTAGGVVYDIDGSGHRTEPKKLANGETVHSARDDAAMRALCALAGDPTRYLIAAERGEVDPTPIVTALQAVTRGLATKHVQDLREIYQPFLFFAFMMLVIEAAIGTRRRRRYPEARP